MAVPRIYQQAIVVTFHQNEQGLSQDVKLKLRLRETKISANNKPVAAPKILKDLEQN